MEVSLCLDFATFLEKGSKKNFRALVCANIVRSTVERTNYGKK